MLAFAFVGLPIAALALPLSLYLPPAYAAEGGLGVAAVGTIFALARVWDLVTDPVMGWLIDRFPSRWGRRRHWVAAALPIILLAVVFLYFPDVPTTELRLGAGLFFLYIGYTMLLVTHQAWAAEITEDPGERARLYGTREMFLIGGILVAVSGPALLERRGADAIEQLAALGLMVMVFLPLAVVLLLRSLPDKPRRSDVIPTPGMVVWRRLFSNRAFRSVLALEFLTGVMQSLPAGVFIFTATHVFDQGDRASLFILVYFAAALLALPFWIRLARRRRGSSVLRTALLVSGVGSLTYFFVPAGSALWFGAAVIMSGSAFGAPLFLTRTLMAGVIDDAHSKDSLASMAFALLATFNKIAGAAAIALSYLFLSSVGFEADGSVVVTDAHRTALLWLFAGSPIVAAAMAHRLCR